MSRLIKKALLALLNSRWLNGTPCRYAFVGNVDAFSREHLESSVHQHPDLTVRQFLAVADAFKSCPISQSGLTVIENGQTREGTIWDVHQLRTELGMAKVDSVRPVAPAAAPFESEQSPSDVPMVAVWLAEGRESAQSSIVPCYFCNPAAAEWTLTLSPYMAHKFSSKFECELAIQRGRTPGFIAVQHSFEDSVKVRGRNSEPR